MACNKWIKGEDTHDIKHVNQIRLFCRGEMSEKAFKRELHVKTLHSPAGFGDIRVRGSSTVTSLKKKKKKLN